MLRIGPESVEIFRETTVYNRIVRPGLALITPEEARDDSDLRRGFDQLDAAIGRWIEREKVPA